MSILNLILILLAFALVAAIIQSLVFDPAIKLVMQVTLAFSALVVFLHYVFGWFHL